MNNLLQKIHFCFLNLLFLIFILTTMTSARAFNTTIYSKLTWMGRRLRDMNDHQSLMTWVNAIHHVKSLLIPTPQSDTFQAEYNQCPTTQRSSSRHLKPPMNRCDYCLDLQFHPTRQLSHGLNLHPARLHLINLQPTSAHRSCLNRFV